MTEVGTLKALGVKEGDVVEFVDADDNGYYGKMTVIKLGVIEGALFAGQINARMTNYGWGIFNQEKFRIISRASESPKAWGDMTDAEKGALLLAKHEDKEIEVWHGDRGCFGEPLNKYLPFREWHAYRVKPESVRGVNRLHCNPKYANAYQCRGAQSSTHVITYETVNGNPDCASIKMEPIE